jgi:acetyl-CoA C-acetyltransferase
MKSVMLGAQAIALGDADCVIAGGFESMSNVPHYVTNVKGIIYTFFIAY